MFYQLLKPYIEVSRSRELKRGEILYHEGDTPKSIYFVESGLIGLFHVAESGKETFLRVFGKDFVLGHRSYFAEEKYHASAIALTKTKIVTIDEDHCQRICQDNPQLLKSMTKILARDLGVAELRLAGLQDKSANIRITEALIYLKLKYPDQTWTRKEIAEYSCSTYETVTRVMTKLEEMALIKKSGRDYDILDQDRMLTLTFDDF